jgi:hypothetical protein
MFSVPGYAYQEFTSNPTFDSNYFGTLAYTETGVNGTTPYLNYSWVATCPGGREGCMRIDTTGTEGGQEGWLFLSSDDATFSNTTDFGTLLPTGALY